MTNANAGCRGGKMVGYIIYGRLKSKRLPNKALLTINGKSLIRILIERISQQVLTLPMYPALTMEETDYIAREIKAFFS